MTHVLSVNPTSNAHVLESSRPSTPSPTLQESAISSLNITNPDSGQAQAVAPDPVLQSVQEPNEGVPLTSSVVNALHQSGAPLPTPVPSLASAPVAHPTHPVALSTNVAVDVSPLFKAYSHGVRGVLLRDGNEGE
ncbi:hypothetical protein RhiJN_21471 [Ceratobasidium sp. AG-Ba]|nr:hypothetical protein RhiJN_21471 [Ceratobasidium sp. AG-Ba]